MSERVLTVFLSATTEDLRPCREAAAKILREAGIFAKFQDELPANFRPLTEHLRKQIRECDAVVCLVGSVFGSAPGGSGHPQRSYTQMEYDAARDLHKPVFVFCTKNPFLEEYSRSKPLAEREAQQAFRQSLFDAHTCKEFESLQDLEKQVALVAHQVRAAVSLPGHDLPNRQAGRNAAWVRYAAIVLFLLAASFSVPYLKSLMVDSPLPERSFTHSVLLRDAGGGLASLMPDAVIPAGDTIITSDAGTAEIVLCAKGRAYNLPAAAEFIVGAEDILPEKGPPLPARDHPSCDLPATTRDLASAQRRGLVHRPPEATGPTKGSINSAIKAPLGPTFALVVGISEYNNLPQGEWLDYADKDAEAFATFLASPRGGELRNDDRIKILTNREAKCDSVGIWITEFMDRARKQNGTFLLLIAAHGIVDEKTLVAHILTYETKPADLSSSGLPLKELADTLGEGLAGLGRMLVFVDVCHSARIWVLTAVLRSTA